MNTENTTPPTHRTNSRAVTAIALILSIVALILAWAAYNRSGAIDLEDQIQQRVDTAVEEAIDGINSLQQEVS